MIKKYVCKVDNTVKCGGTCIVRVELRNHIHQKERLYFYCDVREAWVVFTCKIKGTQNEVGEVI